MNRFRVAKPEFYSVVTFLMFLFAAYIFLVQVKYNFGGSNHGEILPILFRLEDSNYLIDDKYVDGQMLFNARTPFAYLLFFLKKATFGFLSYKYLFFIIYVTVLIHSQYLFRSILKLFIKFETDLLYTIFASILLIGGRFTIGGATLLNSQLLPATIASYLLIAALFSLLKKDYLKLAILLFVSTIFHVLIGLLGGIILWGAYFISNIRKDFRNVLLQSILFGLITLLLISPFILISGESVGDKADLIAYIIGTFRNPHHYLPSSWDLWKITLFYLIQLVALILLFFRRRGNHLSQEHFFIILSCYTIANLLFFAGYVFVELIPINFIIKLQLFRINTLIDLISRIIIVISISYYLVKIKGEQVLLIVGLIYILLVILITVSIKGYAVQLDYKIPVEKLTLYSWINANTDKNDLFIVPIGENDFRVHTDRGIVVTFKQFLFRDQQILNWYNDISNMCGFKKADCTGWDCIYYCENIYSKYNDQEFDKLVQLYPTVDYIIIKSALDSDKYSKKYTLVYQNSQYIIYKVER